MPLQCPTKDVDGVASVNSALNLRQLRMITWKFSIRRKAMKKTYKGLIGILFIAVLVTLNLSPWANAGLLGVFLVYILFGPAIGHVFGRR